MTISEFQTFLNTVKYKPGFSLELKCQSELGESYYILIFRQKVLDADAGNPLERSITVSSNLRIHVSEIESLGPKAWTRIIFNHIRGMEMHEAKEFFFVAGSRPFAPHPEAV